jgi:hypothetical protein
VTGEDSSLWLSFDRGISNVILINGNIIKDEHILY